MIKRLTFLFLLLTVVSSNLVNAQKEKYQTIFIYNFGKYVKWPESKLNDKFVIGVLGNSDITKTLSGMASSNRQAQGLQIEVKEFESISEIGDCQILFIAERFLPQLSKISSATREYSTLLITDAPGMANQGATINFVEQDGKIKFELNMKNAEARGLKVSTTLQSLAILV